MTVSLLQRQLIVDAAGNPIGAILPLEEFVWVENILKQRFPLHGEADKLDRMAQAADDPFFMADLNETMSAFADVDAEWWEPV